ncbi:MAG: ABC transporter permease subunit [Acidobacteriota bacterium]|nr:ABC transporter permease subunit [Acidobacteriota bacterium]
MAAASRSIRRLRQIDRAAVAIIALGGISVVASVLGILVFIVSEALPLFKPASVESRGSVPVRTGVSAAASSAFRATGTDEYVRYLYTVEPAGVVGFTRLDSGARALEAPVAGADTARIVSASRSVTGHHLAAGLSDGRASLTQVSFIPRYDGAVLGDLEIRVRDRAIITLDDGARPIRQVSYIEQDGHHFVAGLVGDDEIAYAWSSDENAGHRALLRAGGERVTHVRVGRNGAVLAGTESGRVYHWALTPEPELTDISPIAAAPVTALEWMLGGNSFVAAAADGSVTGWLRTPTGDDRQTIALAHTFEPQASPVVDMALSGRERSFATLGRDGVIVLRHQTSERVLAAFAPSAPAMSMIIAPKADAILTIEAGSVERFALNNPHPETSWKTLFGKVWYEGYAQPEYVWQSTGATDDIEPKFSLVPLIFGTIKGTFYAMLFAVPLAVLAALYTSQFTDASFRARIKPTVEIMAALPSVVIGFIAGLYLAAVVERHLVAVLMMIPLLPIAGTSGVLLWRVLPRRITGQLRPGTELLVLVPLIAAAGWLATVVAPGAEAWLFGGDARLWMKEHWDLTYDQRNCLVVGIAMGFAVIPIIFTIAEDACSSVPASLTAASLALGASRWQTALRIVLPTASPGIFSAIMVGFGRAVGETMIVLMATGNTPVMDWSAFNGIRTLAANIAVEIPEAPYGGTLYRTLFLAASILFAMTFVVNTAAEIIRQRLRDRYRAI